MVGTFPTSVVTQSVVIAISNVAIRKGPSRHTQRAQEAAFAATTRSAGAYEVGELSTCVLIDQGSNDLP